MGRLIVFKAVCLAFVVMASASLTQAQAPRTWVSGTGDDTFPCSRTAPCRTFAGAYPKTLVNGEINCLDPGSYGSLTIRKSISIDCEDTQGAVLAPGSYGFLIDVSSQDVKKSVKIRGISIMGQALGTNGIRVLAANQVVIDEVVIDGFTQHGISLENTTGATNVLVNKTSIRSNAGNGINSFIIGGNVRMSIADSTITMNSTGVNLSNGTRATVRNSTVTGNATGMLAFNADLAAMGCDISHNTTAGVTASSGSNLRITGNLITNNGTGVNLSGGNLISYTSNVFQGNGVDGVPSTTTGLQ